MLSLVELMAVQNPTRAPARSPLAAGTWRLVWSQQAKTASPLQKFGSKQVGSLGLVLCDALRKLSRPSTRSAHPTCLKQLPSWRASHPHLNPPTPPHPETHT